MMQRERTGGNRLALVTRSIHLHPPFFFLFLLTHYSPHLLHNPQDLPRSSTPYTLSLPCPPLVMPPSVPLSPCSPSSQHWVPLVHHLEARCHGQRRDTRQQALHTALVPEPRRRHLAHNDVQSVVACTPGAGGCKGSAVCRRGKNLVCRTAWCRTRRRFFLLRSTFSEYIVFLVCP